jgi:large subunit ribosomal protein L41
MRKTPSNYVQDIERNGRKVTVIRGFQGKDYLQKWAETAEAEDARLADLNRKNEAEEAISKA